MKKITVGILAHVDAGKTTLAESMIFTSGAIRALGRVDNGNTFLDTNSLEKERGITIFAGQAVIEWKDLRLTLLDTPGHVDFAAETERVMKVLDYALLVISGTDGIQSHTLTLWKLLSAYSIPTFIFVTKTDFLRKTQDEIMAELRKEFGDGCINFSCGDENKYEDIATCSEDALEEYLESGSIKAEHISRLVSLRCCFPCFFGSGLKNEGVAELMDAIDEYTAEPIYPDAFGARVFKISHDKNGVRLTHIKMTGGSLKVRSPIRTGETEEKISGIRLYSGEKFTSLDEAFAGDICVLTGLNLPESGRGLGFEEDSEKPIIEPVMQYRVQLPEGVDSKTFLPKLRLLEQEDPLLRVNVRSETDEIYVGIMGDVQAEILRSIIETRFGVSVIIDNGRVLYKETITDTVEGVGHYEPLRHYAEVHLILSPAPRGSGIIIETKCSEDSLSRNWQRLIFEHILEKQHLGVLTGSPLTDVRITLAAGRAHIKHTEGGDFRQATYRAIRQGLMQAQSILLEPYYSFRLEVPSEQVGRAISDLQAKHCTFSAPEVSGHMSIVSGRGPVTVLNGYPVEIASYTGGKGRILLSISGYDVCHNSEKVIEEFAYNPEGDLENTPDSVFCAHGGGFAVPWKKVPEYMHLESCLKKEKIPFVAAVNKRNFRIDDKELEAIMTKEFGPERQTVLYRSKSYSQSDKDDPFSLAEKKRCIIVDGYNCIFAWDDLKKYSELSLDTARERLIHRLTNFAAYNHCEVILVFDAYMVEGGKGSKYDRGSLHIAFTKERETADTYIERLTAQIGKNFNVTVVTSDNLIQLSAIRFGVLRLSAKAFEAKVDESDRRIAEQIKGGF